jgi:hypothetical protein
MSQFMLFQLSSVFSYNEDGTMDNSAILLQLAGVATGFIFLALSFTCKGNSITGLPATKIQEVTPDAGDVVTLVTQAQAQAKMVGT